jgi:hypothetical protein
VFKMKKYTLFISILILSVILAFPGCGGGSKKDRNPDPGDGDPVINQRIKIFEVSGGVAMANIRGLVFADSLSEIGDQYTVFVANNSEGVVPTIMAYCYDDEGRKIDIPVLFAKHADFDDCFTMDNPSNINGGGSRFNLIGNAPGGKGKLIASANGATREVEVYVYDSFGVLSADRGRKINTDGSHDNSAIRAECAFFSDSGEVKLVGKSYLADSCDGVTWKEKLRAIKTVSATDLAAGDTDNIPTLGQIYVAEVPTGGYIKYVRINHSMIWEYSQTTNFK